MRGTRLKDSVDIVSLKPCHLTIVEGYALNLTAHVVYYRRVTHSRLLIKKNFFEIAEDYTEEQATAHIRRLLDIVACTTAFGSSKPPASRTSPKESGNKDAGDSDSVLSPKLKEPEKKLVVGGGGCEASQAAEGGDKGEINMCPPTRLGQFYEFFSFSHLTPPIQCEFPSRYFIA